MKESRRSALCAAMKHSNQCYFNNCDKIDGACGKTKRIIKASLSFLFTVGWVVLGNSPNKGDIEQLDP